MGILYADGDSVSASDTVEGGKAHVKGTVRKPSGAPLVGVFHNHPGGGREAIKFSDDDKAFARRAKVPSYIVTRDGRVFKFDPKDNAVTEVLHQLPLDQLVSTSGAHNTLVK